MWEFHIFKVNSYYSQNEGNRVIFLVQNQYFWTLIKILSSGFSEIVPDDIPGRELPQNEQIAKILANKVSLKVTPFAIKIKFNI